MATKQQIMAGRQRVDAYRTAHNALYSSGRHKGIPEAHTPLLNAMVNTLNGLGFNSLDEFFRVSDLLNLQELGFADRATFDAKVLEGSTALTEIDPETGEAIELTPEGQQLLDELNGMWH